MFEEEKIKEMLDTMGYDKYLYSIYSRVFTLTLHSKSPVTVKINDAQGTDINERAWDILMLNHYKLNGATLAVEDDRVVIFRKENSDDTTVNYGVINKTDQEVEVMFNQKKSGNMFFTPNSGLAQSIVPPQACVFLASAIASSDEDVPEKRFSFASRFTE
jgi:hypothetical protein